MRPRDERLAELERSRFDVLVVGGGITGAAAARDAASRGLSVAIVEKNDWGSGTSWRSTKLVHGGLRYLRQGEIRLVFESLTERARLLDLAPHLVRPLDFLFAALSGRWVSRWQMEAGLTLYDLLALGRGRFHRTLSAAAAVSAEPLLAGAALAGAATYTDARADDARLTLENVLDADGLGAVAVSRVVFEERVRRPAGASAGAVLRDVESGRRFEIAARVTVEAVGPWTDALERRDDPAAVPRLRLSKGAHVTVPSARLPVRFAVAIPVEAGRLLFAIPGGSVTLIGTTDADYRGSPDAVVADRDEVDYLLARAGEAFPGARLTAGDVIAAFAGVRPLRIAAGRRVSETSREDSIETAPGLVRVTGGKLTTHRRMAARTIDAAVRLLGPGRAPIPGSRTSRRPFPGSPGEPMDDLRRRIVREASGSGISEEVAGHLAGRYGRRAAEALAIAAADPALLSPISDGLPDAEAEVVLAARLEDARSVSDVLIRRTHLFWEAPGQAAASAGRVGRILGRELGWSPEQETLSRDEYLAEVAASRRAFIPGSP
ncbi:MAG: glycerol-3-phosphate dehydrogenase/oxidase [Acidobacteriota bacterium]|nr:glycerol-3-phosphate dehydrogenase/oxidase [Acidobacteriota bacterium]